MRTTLILDDELVAELLHVTQAKTKTDAIHLAIAELIRRKKNEKLKALSGKLSVTDSVASQRRAENKRQALHQRLWHGRR